MKLCVYTVLTGGYEELMPQPVAANSGIPFICLTDNPALRSDHWEIRTVRTAFREDSVRSQRDLKIRPHLHLPDFDASLYIDNTVLLTEPADKVWSACMPEEEVFRLPLHGMRSTVADEFAEVARQGLDDRLRIREQLQHYKSSSPETLAEHPYWTGMLFRRHMEPAVRDCMELWASHVMRYARRDQLSINLAIAHSGVRVSPIELGNASSWFHKWPVSVGRRHDIRTMSEQALDVLDAQGAEMVSLHAEIELQRRENAATALRLAGALAEVAALRSSNSWRLTGPLRRLAMAYRRQR